jgi:predicted signal transduction protein with EAL and GGDEF domain
VALRVVVSVLAIVCMFGLLYGRTHSMLVTCAVVAGVFTAVAASRRWPPA